ncbi:hypothetical protein PFX98_18570 [Paucibacter sediminis]|uniref:Uncharacterized protein n=1 Tax=Paucibacter sediminis TaxID=3019553 RepID=A0AA95NB69_9BURK|nr:hypothetical protein [Paucibacter sp. S2-9]WIT10900.1 hypothetical protein PFX98_18570 [Paucibacter sp. S2-9]
MINAIFSRWVRSDTDALGEAMTAFAGVTASPPARRSHDSILQSLLRWLPGDADPWGSTQSSLGKLPELRAAFLACLDDLDADGPGVQELKRSVMRSRSLRDFWHLRAGIYTQVARSHSQWEAEQRLARLNRHFPFKPVAVNRRGAERRGGRPCN